MNRERSSPFHSTALKWCSLATLVAVLMALVGPSVATQQASAAPIGQGFTLNTSDIRFIRQQIRIAENHVVSMTPSDPCLGILGPGANQVGSPRLPFGLRTVDGTCNNLQPNQAEFGAADNTFPRLLTPEFRDAEPVSPGFGPASGQPTSYNDANNSNAAGFGSVFDSQPRTVSNLIVDQTPNNPAAVAAGGENAEIDPDTDTIFIGNVAPDVGLSAPFNSWFTLFGQFFDHGLDLVTKGGSGTVFMPLKPDDPLFSTAPGSFNFMLLTRASTQPGGAREGTNTTTPFVDQNQTYTSHPSHQVFLREYELNGSNDPIPTGRLIDGAIAGNIANWSEVKAQAAALLGIGLQDADVLNVPLLATDPYGHFIPGPNGFPQVVFPGNVLTEGNPLAPISVAGSLKTGHAFLDDIAHNAAPGTFDHDSNPGTAPIQKTADTDGDVSTADQLQPAGTYDNELLDLHFITGDGRGNENIGLTAVHTVFHSEHNRLVDDIHNIIQTQLTPAEIADWEAVAAAPPAGTGWGYGERLFQAARFVTEMEYQHLVFEEFGRKVQPQINVFSGYHTEIDPAISAEFAHTVYRFGHSMLTETVDRTLPNGSTANIDLFDAFLNPVAFNNIDHDNNPGTAPIVVDASVAAGSIAQAMSRQVGNEIDEFVTDALRNRLVGLPLDLAAINMARGRSEGIPSLNEARRQFFAQVGEPSVEPYTSWADFSFNIKHRESLVNFVAAYGTHPTILAETTIAGKRTAAQAILDGPQPGPDGVLGDNPLTTNANESLDDIPPGPGPDNIFTDDLLTPVDESADNTPAQPGPDGVLGDNPLTTNANESLDDIGPSDALDFMLSTGAWASQETGLNLVDFWVGGLAEQQEPFGGMLGSTFNFVFERQMENLQDGDRFYYLTRTAGLNMLVQLEGNSFSEMIMRNTSAEGLAAEVFARPDWVFNIANLGTSGPILDDPATAWNEAEMLFRNIPTAGTIRFDGPEHVIWNGTEGVDKVFSSEGDDTIRLNGGNDVAEGGSGNDQFVGGEGNDILTDKFGDDVIKGGPGNDAISSGQGFDLNQGGTGHDFVVGGSDPTETFGGPGNDIIFAGDSFDTVFGDDGDDWIEGGNQADLLQGDNGAPFQNDINQPGHDVIIGGGGDDDYDSEGGDDIMVDGPGIQRSEGMLGFDWVTYRGSPEAADADMFFTGLLPPDLDNIKDRFDNVEALSGWDRDDILRGTDDDATVLAVDHELNAAGIARISGLSTILPVGATSFNAGNIILGGAGSDLIEGRGGDDIIDGDRWLNVQLVHGSERADSMQTFRARVFAGQIDPGNITIERSIVNAGPGGATDTAVFSGLRAEYTITTGAGGRLIVTHDNGGVDGVDTLFNMERLQFADVNVPTNNAVNVAATGTPTLVTTTLVEGTPVTANTAGIADANGLPAGFSFQWQQGAGAVFNNIAGATGAAFTPTQAQVGQQIRVVVSFTDLGGFGETLTSAASGVVGDLFVGGGAAETFNGTAGADSVFGNGGPDTLNTLGGNDTVSGGTGNDTITTAAGNDIVSGDVGSDTINTGADNDIIRFTGTDEGFDNINGGAGTDSIEATGPNVIIGISAIAGIETITGLSFANVSILGSGNGDVLNFAAVTLTNIVSINGGGGGDTITGNGAANVINGDAGADTINGGAGVDTIAGGGGADTMDGGANDDIFVFTPNFGNDTINGFDFNPAGGQDRLNIAGTGVTAGNFAARVTIAATNGGTRTLVTIRNGTGTVIGTISLNGGPANYTQADFIL